MKVLFDIPENIVEVFTENPDTGRTVLQEKHNLSQIEARFYARLWKERETDSSPKVLGMHHILQDRTSEQALRIKHLEKRIATEDILLNKIEECIPVLKVAKSLPILTKSKSKIKENREATTIWSDWHAFEKVDSDQMEGFNHFDVETLLSRIWDLVRGIIRVVENQKNSFDIDTLNIDLLGDMVSGNIHQELRESNEYPMLQTVLLLAHITAQSIIALIPYFKKVRVMGLVGNHGRMTQKPSYKNKVLDNYDTLFYHILSMYLKDYIEEERVEFKIPASPECVTVRKGWAFLLGHSDHIKAWAGFPVYGFFRDNAKQQQMRKMRSVFQNGKISKGISDSLEGAIVNMRESRMVSGYDYREGAHFHTYMLMDDGTTILNGSLIGGNEYSMNKIHAIGKPLQALMFISEQWGLKSLEPIYVRDKGHGFHLFEKGGVLGEAAKYVFSILDKTDDLTKEV